MANKESAPKQPTQNNEAIVNDFNPDMYSGTGELDIYKNKKAAEDYAEAEFKAAAIGAKFDSKIDVDNSAFLHRAEKEYNEKVSRLTEQLLKRTKYTKDTKGATIEIPAFTEEEARKAAERMVRKAGVLAEDQQDREAFARWIEDNPGYHEEKVAEPTKPEGIVIPVQPEISKTSESSGNPEKTPENPTQATSDNSQEGEPAPTEESSEQKVVNIDELKKFNLTAEQKLSFAYRDFHSIGEDYKKEVDRIMEENAAQAAEKKGFKENTEKWKKFKEEYLKDEGKKASVEDEVNKTQLGKNYKLAKRILNEQSLEAAPENKKVNRIESQLEKQKIVNTVIERLENDVKIAIKNMKDDDPYLASKKRRLEQIKRMRTRVKSEGIELQLQRERLAGYIYRDHQSELDSIDIETDGVAKPGDNYEGVGFWKNLEDSTISETLENSGPEAPTRQRTEEEKEYAKVVKTADKIEKYLTKEFNVFKMIEPDNIMNILYSNGSSEGLWRPEEQKETGITRIKLSKQAKDKIAELLRDGVTDFTSADTLKTIFDVQVEEQTPEIGSEQEKVQFAISQIENDLTNKFHTYKPEDRKIFYKAARKYLTDLLHLDVPDNERLASYDGKKGKFGQITLDGVTRQKVSELADSGVTDFVNFDELEKLSASEQDKLFQGENQSHEAELSPEKQKIAESTPESESIESAVGQIESYFSNEYNNKARRPDSIVSIVTDEKDPYAPSRSLWAPIYEPESGRLGIGLTEAGKQRVGEMLQNGITDFTNEDNLRILFGLPSSNSVEV